MRDGVKLALERLAERYDNLVVLDADVGFSTRTAYYGKIRPNMFFNIGPMEQAMFGIAAGLAIEGFKVIASTFATFVLRGYEIIRNSIALEDLDVKIVGTHAGVSVGEDGPTHQAIEDIAAFYALPNFRILSPADKYEVVSCLEYAIEDPHPYYIRVSRVSLGDIYRGIPKFKPCRVLIDGSDLTIIATGVVVYEAVEAAKELLNNFNISVKVIQVTQLKPFPTRDVLKEVCGEAVITVEDHNIYGGLASILSQTLLSSSASGIKIVPIGVPDKFGISGKSHDVMRKFGILKEDIIKLVKELTKNDSL